MLEKNPLSDHANCLAQNLREVESLGCSSVGNIAIGTGLTTVARHDELALSRRLYSSGFSLIELLIGIALVSILSALLIPSFQPNQVEILRDTAQLVASDLRLLRSLAVSTDTDFAVDFHTDSNKYVLRQVNGGTVLSKLPRRAFSRFDDLPSQLTQYFEDLPNMGSSPRLYAVLTGSGASVTGLQFEPLGNTTRTDSTLVWVSIGSGTDQRFISITVDPVTGVSTINDITAIAPTIAFSQL